MNRCYRLGSQADVDRLATRAVACPVGCAIDLVLDHHDRPSNAINLFHEHCFLILYSCDDNIPESRIVFPAVLLDNLQ
jgi:hypothetical protein